MMKKQMDVIGEVGALELTLLLVDFDVSCFDVDNVNIVDLFIPLR